MFQLNSQLYYEVHEWTRAGWLRHGFGTRDALPPSEPIATVKQIHGPEVRIVEHEGQQGPGDGLISDTPGLILGIKTADCLPILLIDPAHRVVSAVHAGWRGTVAGIATRAVQLMWEKFGSKPAEIEAAIGPGIGRCCFEVGPEVARQFGPWNSESKTCLDLTSINRTQLHAVGLKQVYESGLCTMCGEGFYSFRRDHDQAGRMLSFVGVFTA